MCRALTFGGACSCFGMVVLAYASPTFAKSSNQPRSTSNGLPTPGLGRSTSNSAGVILAENGNRSSRVAAALCNDEQRHAQGLRFARLYLERIPFRWNRNLLYVSLSDRIFCREPVSTSPENALG
jgi:hypothetical protein